MLGNQVRHIAMETAKTQQQNLSWHINKCKNKWRVGGFYSQKTHDAVRATGSGCDLCWKSEGLITKVHIRTVITDEL
jgi:hypothetical protein